MREDPTKASIFFCGGTILDEKTILSAAHCFYDQTGQDRYKYKIELEVGFVVHLNKTNPEKLEVRKYYTHPNYNPLISQENDIAILKLKKPLKFNRVCSKLQKD